MLRDVRQAWRAIARMPMLAAVVIVSLAIGIGVNTIVFSWIQAVVLRPLPGVAGAASFHFIEPRTDTGTYPGVSWLEYRDFKERLRSMPDPLAFRTVPFNVGDTGHVERTYGQLVSANYFSALGLRPALGRFFRADDVARAGSESVVVISHGYWRTRFAASAGALGQAVRVNGRPLTIVGVAPERFQGTVLSLSFDLWVPATMAPALFAGSREIEDRALRGYSVIGKLGAHVTREQAQAELDQAMRDLAQAYPDTNKKMQGEVLPFWRALRGPPRMLGRALVTLQGIMLLLLLAVCGNTANLMLARASARQREIGVRLALGAGPWHVAGALLTENLMLALVGASLAVPIAVWGTDALRAVPIITAVPVKFQTELDAVSLAFAALLAVVCGLLFGAAPAAQLARVDPQAALRSGLRTAGRSRLRNALMSVEVGLALVVLLAAALFFRSFNETRGTDPGFKREGVLLAAYDLEGRNVGAPAAREFTRRLLDRLRSLPEVESAAVALSVPLDIHGLPIRSFTLEGRARSPGDDAAPDQALTNTVTPDYFRTMGIPLRAGSDFVHLDDAATPPQAIVNEEFVRRFVGGAEPIGRRLQTRGASYVIAGVVRNSVSNAFGEQTSPVIYLSYRDRPAGRGEMHLRTRAGAESLLAPQVERIVRDLDPTLPVYDVRTLTDHVEKNLFLLRVPARMFVVLGPALLMLAAVGIYAVVAYTVAQRTTEIGVRLALGATARRVVSEIVGDSLRVVASGAMVGWAIAVVLNLHLVRGPLYVSVFGGVPLLLVTVAAVASWLPARRATEVDPIVALRQE